MKLTIAIPTYQRPEDLSKFINRHLGKLEELGISVIIFHNESNPIYSPEPRSNLRCIFAEYNKGITGNGQRISHFFDNPNEYYIYTSDQESLNFHELSLLNNFLRAEIVDCMEFNRGDSNLLNPGRTIFYDKYANWLKNVAVSETFFVIRGGLCHKSPQLQVHKHPGMALWKQVPTHSDVLHHACKGNFIGAKTDLNIFNHDILGSITSGWTAWLPNIIICHLVFIKFCQYSIDCTSCIYSEIPHVNTGDLVKGFAEGLYNHTVATVIASMYCGPRLACSVVRIIQRYSHAFKDVNLEIINTFYTLNTKPIESLPSKWREVYDKYSHVRRKFEDTYPDWIF